MTNYRDDRAALQHTPPKPSSWGQDRRLQFIDFRLRWDGRLNRADVTSFFGISIPQASLDIAKYAEAAPGNLDYDKSTRTYVATEKFRPLYARSSSQCYVHELLATSTGIGDPSMSFVGWRPPLDTAPRPGRAIDPTVLVPLTRVIRDKRKARVTYQSMTSEQPTARELSPHALGFDGFRWHVRAYCHLRNRFQDFVIARIIDIEAMGTSDVGPASDAAWHRKLQLVLTAHPGLSAAAQRAIEVDYGMCDGKVSLECRHAMLFYTLRNLRLDEPHDAEPRAQQIWLQNRAELELYINEVTPSA